MLQFQKVQPEPTSKSDFTNELEKEGGSRSVETVLHGEVSVGKSRKYQPKRFDVWAMAISTVIGGSMYGWNGALAMGFGSYFVAQLLVGLAFVILVYALAEIVSTTSFSSGSYGMARVLLGFYPGFLMACFELMEYLSYTAASTQFITQIFCNMFNLDSQYQPLMAVGLYLMYGVLAIERGHIYWRFIYLIAIFSVVVILIYCFGSLPNINFAANASLQIDSSVDSSGNSIATNDDSLTVDTKNWFHGGIWLFLGSLPFTTWGFAGIESGALVTSLINEPQKNLPSGIVAGVWTLFVLLFFLIFVACSLPPGLTTVFLDDDGTMVNNQFFMNEGFQLMGVSATTAQWLLLPAQVGMAFGFVLPSAKLFDALSSSRLFPSPPSLKWMGFDLDPVSSSLLVTIPASFGIYLLANYVTQFDITNTPILFATITYLSDLYASHQLQNNFSTLERQFRNPFGSIGAIYAGLVFLLCSISILICQDDYTLFYVLTGYVTVCSIYYFLYSNKRQILSGEEEKALFQIHIMKYNQRKRKLLRKSAALRFQSIAKK